MTTLDLFDLWQSLLTEVNVSQNGQIPPFVFQNWCNTISNDLFREYFSDYEKSQQIQDELKLPFLKTVSLTVTAGLGATYGVITVPTDYGYLSSMKLLRQKDLSKCGQKLPDIDCGNGKCARYVDADYAQMAIQFASENLVTKRVEVIDNFKWDSCLEHRTKGASYDSPKATETQGGFKIAPAGIQLVLLDYLVQPTACVFAYTISTDDILVYNAAGSTQLQWSGIMKQEFMARLVKKYAKYVQSESVFGMAENERKIN